MVQEERHRSLQPNIQEFSLEIATVAAPYDQWHNYQIAPVKAFKRRNPFPSYFLKWDDLRFGLIREHTLTDLDSVRFHENEKCVL